MIKNIYILLFLLETFTLNIYSQESADVIVNSKFTECQNETILTTLDNEPAYMQKGCYNYLGKVDSFTVVLLNQPNIDFYVREVYPIGQVPDKFRTDNLYVFISGNILNRMEDNKCTPHNIENQKTNMFELKSIKINERGECSRCNDSTILVVLKDEPALIHRGCLFESDLYYFVLINEPKINHYISNWIFPCEKIPENFQIDGLSVLVSGNILRSGKGNPCFPSKPNIRVAPTNMFELKSIKLANVHDNF